MLKTKYKPLLIAGLLFLLIAPIIATYSIFIGGHLFEKSYRLAFAFVFIISMMIVFLIQNPIIIFDENSIKRKSVFKTTVYNWDKLTGAILAAKVNHPVLLFPRQQTAIILKFENGSKIILGEEVYTELNEIRKIIVGKAQDKIRDQF
jgi:hypothetical protein